MSMVVRCLDQVNERALALSGTSMQGGRSEPEKIPSPERHPGQRTRKSQARTASIQPAWLPFVRAHNRATPWYIAAWRQ